MLKFNMSFKKKLSLFSLICCSALLAFGGLTLNIKSNHLNQTLRTLKKKEFTLKKNNQQLQMAYQKQTSLLALEPLAATLNLTHPSNITYVQDPTP